MSCLDNNPCTPDPNPCYTDCGCLNPTTFECITLPGTLTSIGVTNDMNGLEALAAINTTIQNLTITPSDPAADVYVKISNGDTTANYLNNKLIAGSYLTSTILNTGGNEQLRINANLAAMISSDGGNLLEIGTDNKMRVILTVPPADIVILGGSGVTVAGTGPSSDPYTISINPSISVLRSCFDGVWHNITLVSTGNVNVVYVSGTPQYKIRFDGVIEFRGSATYTVDFDDYSASGRSYTITAGNLPTTCITVGEQAGVSDLKSITYIDQPQASADQITQLYGYIIRKSTQNIQIVFQSSFTNETSKTIVVNFEGAISYPTLV